MGVKGLIRTEAFHADWYDTKKTAYDKCGFVITELSTEEGKEYGACTFKLNGKVIKFRVAKVTPKKTGQFVAIWRRNDQGVTQPFEAIDEIDFMVISTRKGNHFGQFIFPKAVLIHHGIITNNQKEGKRGMRVYPPWDKAENKQAEKTQSWQLKYFLNIEENNLTDIFPLYSMSCP